MADPRTLSVAIHPVFLPAALDRSAFRRNSHVRAIVSAWRRLAGQQGRKASKSTLVACSGGADSVALLLALSTATDRFVVAHVTHDLRSPAEAAADRDFVRDLALRLGLAFAEASVPVRRAVGTPGSANLESRARVLRYAALERLAREHGCPCIAVAHHADDQLETMLMALMRGAGARGLSGMPAELPIGKAGVQLIRPMLAAGGRSITREVSRELCRAAGVDWREDATNSDTSLLRAAVRHRIVPVLKELRPRVTEHAAASAEVFQDAARLLSDQARRVGEQGERRWEPVAAIIWTRASLRAEMPSVLFEVVRRSHLELASRERLDRMSRAALGSVVRAIKDGSTEERMIDLARVRVRVTSRRVTVELRERVKNE